MCVCVCVCVYIYINLSTTFVTITENQILLTGKQTPLINEEKGD